MNEFRKAEERTFWRDIIKSYLVTIQVCVRMYQKTGDEQWLKRAKPFIEDKCKYKQKYKL